MDRRTAPVPGEGSPPRRPAVCSRCGASSTPMWRSGPAGPKTLCNACGIRYRKTKGSGGASSPATVAACDGGEDRGRAEVRKRGERLQRREVLLRMLLQEGRRRFAFLCGDEEAEAAVLLMAISSGLLFHTSH